MLIIRHIELKDANNFVEKLHRHHKKAVGHRFSLACFDGDKLVGVCIVGRPVSRGCNFKDTLEVTRLCTDGTKNACSILYTHGGFHLLVKLEDIEERYQKTWYNQLMDLNPDVVGDNFIPIPGTYQGGFTPKLTSLE